jgi:hypothetical protein
MENITLTPNDRRFLVKVANGRGKAVASGPEWHADDKLLRVGFIEKVIAAHVGCSLGARKLSRRGLRVLGACIDALDRPGKIKVQ